MSRTTSGSGAEPFSQRLLAWFDVEGRKDLPWQTPRDPYRVWVSEIMLQQTQVATVIPYFQRFIERFPDLPALAAASQDDVLSHWAGLGYYARARNLHRTAQQVCEQHQGELPQTIQELLELPGIGRSTAGAILAQAWNQVHPILDGNVRRVIARHRAIEMWTGDPKVQERLWDLAQSWLPQQRAADYTQAIMDLGSLVCTRSQPRCPQCPVQADCQARQTGRTSELPVPRPRRVRPVRKRAIALIENERGDLLLWRRASAGIWGGLWCPPLGEDNETAGELCQRLGVEPCTDDARALPMLRHALTHFELQLFPVRATYSVASAQLQETTPEQWISPQREKDWPGLPAPVRALIRQMRQHAQDLESNRKLQ